MVRVSRRTERTARRRGNGATMAQPTASAPAAAGTMARAKLLRAMNRVQSSVHVKRKYLVQSCVDAVWYRCRRWFRLTVCRVSREESKRGLQETKDKLVQQGVLKPVARMDVLDVAKAALRNRRQLEARDWTVKYSEFCSRFKDLVTDAAWFKNAVTVAIFVAGINVGAQTYDLPDKTLRIFEILDQLVLTIFVIECVLNIFAEGLKPWKCVLEGSCYYACE